MVVLVVGAGARCLHIGAAVTTPIIMVMGLAAAAARQTADNREAPVVQDLTELQPMLLDITLAVVLRVMGEPVAQEALPETRAVKGNPGLVFTVGLAAAAVIAAFQEGLVPPLRDIVLTVG